MQTHPFFPLQSAVERDTAAPQSTP